MAANMMKPCGSVVFILCCLAPVAGWTQVLSDPTRPPPGMDDATTSASITTYSNVRGLQTVIISPSHCAAVIDGKTVELGSKHGAERLVEVSEHGVVLQGENGRRSLMLFPAVSKKSTENVATGKQTAVCKIEKIKQTKNPAEKAGQKERK